MRVSVSESDTLYAQPWLLVLVLAESFKYHDIKFSVLVIKRYGDFLLFLAALHRKLNLVAGTFAFQKRIVIRQ